MRGLPTSTGLDGDADTAGWFGRAVPDRVAVRALSVDVLGPGTVTVGEPARFVVRVSNRLPVRLDVTLPTSRLWGWRVNGIPEADERGYRPPAASRTASFGRRERRHYEAVWDGRVRVTGDGGDRWESYEGTVTFTGYLAVDNWEGRGLYDRTTVSVVGDS